ncbi:uncharacterized protein [Cicer arietinum]|uniref:uncharacterized protein isoform X2 n=1 Tax=Cicer arietinum TaxID=3827 RepID=UPI003CC55D41
MAKQPLWSPPEFDATLNFPSEFPYEFELSSPESTESSDEEENFFAGLTQRLSQSTLNETRSQLSTTPPTKTRDLAGSPQSTLSGIGSWSGRSNSSGSGSPNGNSRVPSPVTAPFNDPWEVIYAAAGQVARLKMNNNQVGPTNANIFSNQSFNQVEREVKKKQECGFVYERETNQNPNWLIQQQQLLIQNRRRELGYESGRCNVPLSFQSQQNQRVQYGGSGSGFRVMVPGGSSAKRVSGGTGVFLPRHYHTPSDSRCAPVMLPAKTVNAMNLNIEGIHVNAQPRFSNVFVNDFDLLLARRNALLKQQRLIARREEAASCEIRLPQEWTY